ncbi:hypothetical protein BGX28_008915 [Mortierella sp. GBA30]|nr:hypothetical protein BGX28_008915 [Mortierella sp. GBA30]
MQHQASRGQSEHFQDWSQSQGRRAGARQDSPMIPDSQLPLNSDHNIPQRSHSPFLPPPPPFMHPNLLLMMQQTQMQQQLLQQQYNAFLSQSDPRPPAQKTSVPEDELRGRDSPIPSSTRTYQDQGPTRAGEGNPNIRPYNEERSWSQLDRSSMDSPQLRQDILHNATQHSLPMFNIGNSGPPGFDSQFGAPAMVPMQTPNGLVYVPVNRMTPPPGLPHFTIHPSEQDRIAMQPGPQYQSPYQQQPPPPQYQHQQQMLMHQQMFRQQQEQHQSQIKDIESQINQFLFKSESTGGGTQGIPGFVDTDSPLGGKCLTVQEVEEAQARELQNQLHKLSLDNTRLPSHQEVRTLSEENTNGVKPGISGEHAFEAPVKTRISSILESRFRTPLANNASAHIGHGTVKSPLTAKDIDFYSDRKYDPYRPSSHTFDLLTRDAKVLCEELKPKPEEETRKLALLRRLSDIAIEVFGEAEVLPFGSSGNGLALANADMDVCVFLNAKPGCEEVSPVEFVERIGERLEKDADFENILQLKRARVPIVKLNHVNGIACDIGYQNDLAIWNTRMLRAYCKIDERVRDIVVIIKLWAKRRKINNPYTGSLSSYAYVLLVIHVLQKRGVLPNLQSIVVGSGSIPFWPCQGFNRYFFEDIPNLARYWQPTPEALGQSVGELLYEFFRYYASEFRYATQVVSIRSGGLLTKEAKEWTKDFTQSQNQQYQQQQQQQPQPEPLTETEDQVQTPPTSDAKPVVKNRYLFCIEDPFELDHNVGRPVDRYSLFTIRGEFMRAAKILSRNGDGAITRLCMERDVPAHQERNRNSSIDHGDNQSRDRRQSGDRLEAPLLKPDGSQAAGSSSSSADSRGESGMAFAEGEGRVQENVTPRTLRVNSQGHRDGGHETGQRQRGGRQSFYNKRTTIASEPKHFTGV